MKAKGDVSYGVTYTNTEGKSISWLGQDDLDYFYARYCYIVLLESGNSNYQDVKLCRYTKREGQPTLVEVIDPVARINSDVRYAVFGTNLPLLDERYAKYIKTEGEADAMARGVELGIARCAAFLQIAGANTSDDRAADILGQYAEELLIHAPAHHAIYKSLTEALAQNAEMREQLETIKTRMVAAKAEYYDKLGETPRNGIMDLPITRLFLETSI